MENNKDVNLTNYVNFEMNEIHELSSDLYESMMDRENETVVSTAESLIERLKIIQKSHK